MRTFPILVSFDGKPPLVTGGGELAAVKARLLLKRAPSVDIAADAVGPELAALAESGLVSLIPARPGMDQLRGRPLVIAATEDDAEDSRVSAIARALGVPVNVPDRPELCTFALPAIVDRGEVTVAIGTSGASPVLAQRLRAWLEQELHPRLDALAKLAAEFRGPVAERLPSGPPRRKFWEAVFEGAAAEAMLEGDEDRARALIGAAIEEAAEKPAARGRVLLVGAGPGDPELLTMKAVRALKAADVILYDRLVGEGVLDHARREAELIPVGKAKGAHSVPQEEINALLIARAQAGQTVVRLKGGDPFIFGRGGEELDALREAGIAVEIVPGVTAGIAAPRACKFRSLIATFPTPLPSSPATRQAEKSPPSSISILPRSPPARTRCSSIWARPRRGISPRNSLRRASEPTSPCSPSRTQATTMSAACSRPSPSSPRILSGSGSRALPC